MRFAVILAAILLKSYLWFRLVPRFVGHAVLAAAIAIALTMFAAALKLDKKRPSHTGPFCESAEPDYDGFRSCEFKLRDARLDHSDPMRH